MPEELKILWIKTGPLYPLDTGGKKRTHSMLVELSKEHEVTYLALKERSHELAEEEPGAAYAAHKRWIAWDEVATGTPRFFADLLWNFLFSSLPYALAKYRSQPLQDEIMKIVGGEKFDLVICDFLSPAVNFLRIVETIGVPTVLFQHNVEAQIWKRLAAGKRNPLARW